MAILSILPTIMREAFGVRRMAREPEPDLTMEEAEQVEAYAKSGGVMQAAYTFHTARISAVMARCRTVLDLGCGPATQLLQVAALNPTTQFIGVDLSEAMLAKGEARARQEGLSNVHFVRGDITTLSDFADASVDGVISTMALHHLPTADHLAACFRAIARVLAPGGAIYVTDFVRLKSASSAKALVAFDAETTHPLFARDYEASLRAAFLRQDFSDVAGGLPTSAELFVTAPLPALMVLKTPDRPLAPDLYTCFAERRAKLPPKFRRALDDFRLVFRLGGMSQDPFRIPSRSAPSSSSESSLVDTPAPNAQGIAG